MKLNDVKSPSDIRGLSIDELKSLCAEMRTGVLKRCAAISGHVGSNLGDMELVTAIHYVFDTPKDKFVLDVSHQDFPHKMLTGRAYGFFTEKGYDEIGEYTDPKESPEYDIFYAGHTSPSISLCTGLAKAREINGENYRIIALIGDGSLSGGEAFEGLNAGANIKGNFVVVVNDNQMAIAPNYGGMYRNLRELRETNGTASLNLFKAFGWDYIYVADGNNLEDCITALRKAAEMNHPVVVHVNTQKGEGYVPAERNREMWHYFGPFVEKTGLPTHSSDNPNYSELIRDFLLRKNKESDKLLVVASATPESYGFLEEERSQLGSHYIDVDIAEQTAVSVMAGAARGGAKVVYPINATFMQRAYDQLLEDWAMNKAPALMPVLFAGVNGIPDETHLGLWDIPFLTSIPDIIYLAPTNVEEFEAMMEWGFNQNKHKVAVRVPTYGFVHASGSVDSDYSDINQFKLMHKGAKVALIGVGDYYPKAQEVAALLKKDGIDASIINPRFISGIDKELLNSLADDHQLIVTIEDGSVDGGFGQRIAAAVGSTGMKTLSLGFQREFVDRYKVADIEEKNGLLPEQIASKITEILKKTE